MDYKIMSGRLGEVLERDKYNNPEFLCDVLKGELSPIVAGYLQLENMAVRYKKMGDRLQFNVEIDAQRVKPFGYLPRG